MWGECGQFSTRSFHSLSQSLKWEREQNGSFRKILYGQSRVALSRSLPLPLLLPTSQSLPTLRHINKTLSFAHEFLIRLYLYTALPPPTKRCRRRWINKEFSLGFSHVYALNWMLYGFSLIEVVKKSTSHNKALEDPSVYRWFSPRATVCVCARGIP